MSVAGTVPGLRNRIRVRLRETDSRRPSTSLVEIDEAICDAFLAISQRIPASAHVASAFTIAAGGDTFTLPVASAAQYREPLVIRLRSTGEVLEKKTREEVDAFRQAQPTVVLGIPRIYCLWEEADRDVQGRCYPGAKVAEICDLMKGALAEDLRVTDLDTVTINLSRDGERALVAQVAAELLAKLDEPRLQLRGFDSRSARDSVSAWRREAEEAIYREEARVNDLEGATHVQRWAP